LAHSGARADFLWAAFFFLDVTVVRPAALQSAENSMKRTLFAAFFLMSLALVATGSEDFRSKLLGEYASKAASVGKADAAGHYKLALWCKDSGLAVESKRELRVVVTLNPDHRAARRALGFEKIGGRWVAGKDKMRAKGFVKHEGAWLTPEEYKLFAADEVAAAEARTARKTGNSAIKLTWNKDPRERARGIAIVEGMDAKHRLRPLSITARASYPDVRLRAVRALGAMNNADALPPLYKRAIFDKSETIRKAAVQAIKDTDAKGKIGPFVKALESPFDSVRLHSVQALGAMGDTGAVGPLVRRYAISGGSGQLVYITQVRQVSYVQDFDVEVAQTSFIADPVIGVLQEGIVHAFRALSIDGFVDVYEQPALADALHNLTGKNLGNDKAAWVRYWKAMRLADLREKKRQQHERVSD
jgi:hypothetical protein